MGVGPLVLPGQGSAGQDWVLRRLSIFTGRSTAAYLVAS